MVQNRQPACRFLPNIDLSNISSHLFILPMRPDWQMAPPTDIVLTRFLFLVIGVR